MWIEFASLIQLCLVHLTSTNTYRSSLILVIFLPSGLIRKRLPSCENSKT